MDVLWEAADPLSVREVSGLLTDRDLAHTTVMTVLDRLAKKGFARRERNGRAWHYRAAESREAYVTELMLSALDQTGDRQAALAQIRPQRVRHRGPGTAAGPGSARRGCPGLRPCPPLS